MKSQEINLALSSAKDTAYGSLLPVPKNKKPEKAFDSWFLRAMMRSIQFSHFSFLCKPVVLLYSAVIKIYPSWDTLPVKQLTRIFHAVSSFLIISLSWAMVFWFFLTTYGILCYVSFSLANLCSNVSSQYRYIIHDTDLLSQVHVAYPQIIFGFQMLYVVLK